MAAVICKDMNCTYIVYLVAVYGRRYLQRYEMYLNCVSCYCIWLPLFAKICIVLTLCILLRYMAAVICKDTSCSYIVYLDAVYGCRYLQRYELYLHCVSCCGIWLPLFAKIPVVLTLCILLRYMAAVICKDTSCTYIVYLVAVYGCRYLQRYELYLHCVSCCGLWLPLFAKI